mmetsp:Transcript_34600/g.108688  ORF Transcript_34600/g.108688 Transcript_34600/m.108688 type:complete len:220 (+) Transcript_34600:323-982(+)
MRDDHDLGLGPLAEPEQELEAPPRQVRQGLPLGLAPEGVLLREVRLRVVHLREVLAQLRQGPAPVARVHAGDLVAPVVGHEGHLGPWTLHEVRKGQEGRLRGARQGGDDYELWGQPPRRRLQRPRLPPADLREGRVQDLDAAVRVARAPDPRLGVEGLPPLPVHVAEEVVEALPVADKVHALLARRQRPRGSVLRGGRGGEDADAAGAGVRRRRRRPRS